MTLRSRAACLLGLITLIGWGPLAAQVSEDQLDDWVLRGEEALALGLDAKALRFFGKFLAEEADDPEVLGFAFRAEANLGRWADARATGERWLATADTAEARRSARIASARLARILGDVDSALEALAPLLGQDPPDFSAEAEAGRARLLLGQDELAKGHFEELRLQAKRVIIRKPADLVALSHAYRFFGGPKAAEEVLVEAQKAAGDEDPAPSVALGWLYLEEMSLPGDAAKEFERALEIRRNLAPALFGAASAYSEWQKGEREAESRELLARVNPRWPADLAARARTSLGNLAVDASRQLVAQLEELAPGLAETIATRAAFDLLTLGQAAFEKRIDTMLKRDATYGRGLVLVAEVLNLRRRWPEALELCRRAVSIDEKDATAWDRLARYALWLGYDDEGSAALQRADREARFSTVWRTNLFEVRRTLDRFYKPVATDRFLHRFHRREIGALLPLVRPFAERSYELLAERYSYIPTGVSKGEHEGKILVEWFRDPNGFSVRTLGFTHFGALGVCFGPFIGMNSPGARPPGAFSWARTFHHELAHTMTVGITEGRTTRWLTEGLSTYEEIRFDAGWDRGAYRELHSALESDTLFGVARFDAGFATPRVLFAYFQAGLVCRFLEEKFGFEAIRSLLEGYAKDQTTREILRSELKISAARFDEEFQAWVRELLAGTRLQPRLPPEAVVDLAAAFRDAPDDRELGLRLAVAYAQRGQSLDARGVLGRVTDADSDPRTHWIRAWLARRSDAGAALASATRALDMPGFEDFDLRMLRARLYEAREDRTRAKAEYQAALAAFPLVRKAEDPRLRLAALAEADGDQERAIELLEEHVARNFDALAVRQKLIAHWRSEGDAEREREHLQDLLLLIPLDAEVQLRLAELDEAAGRWSSAADRAASTAFLIEEGRRLAAGEEQGANGEDWSRSREAQWRVKSVRLRLAAPPSEQAALDFEVLSEELQRARALDDKADGLAEIQATLARRKEEGR